MYTRKGMQWQNGPGSTATERARRMMHSRNQSRVVCHTTGLAGRRSDLDYKRHHASAGVGPNDSNYKSGSDNETGFDEI